jgi:hypothetical protein
MINRGKGMLITGGLIMKKRKNMGSGKRTVVPTWFKEKPEKKGAALEESRTEAGRD